MPGIIGSVITAKEDEIEVNLPSYLSGPNIAIIFGPSGQNIFDEILVLAEKMTGPNMP